MKHLSTILLALIFTTGFISFTPKNSLPLKLALLKYNGGGDWYANPTSLTNLAKFCNKELHTNFDPNYATVEVGSCLLYTSDAADE